MPLPTIGKNEKAYTFLARCALIAAALGAAALAFFALIHTCTIDPLAYADPHILFARDNVLVNLVMLAAAFVAIRLLGRLTISDRLLRTLATAGLLLLFAVGMVWVTSVNAIPAFDQGVLYRAAESLIAGDYAEFSQADSVMRFYFLRFPFQFGYLKYVETCIRLFGSRGAMTAIPVSNVILLISGYAALLMATDRLFADNRVTLLTLLAICACPQPLLSCTLIYGLIPGVAMTLWAVYFAVCYLKTDRTRNLLPCMLFCALACLFKLNALIAVVAIAIALTLHALRKKRVVAVVAAVIMVLAALFGSRVPKYSYERELDTTFGSGLDMSVWMAMGMRESWMAPGWYNSYMWNMHEDLGTDIERYNAQSRTDIADCLQTFRADPSYCAQFYLQKFQSQWNEPSFMSVWASGTCEPFDDQPWYVLSVYDRGAGKLLDFLMNQSLQLLYFGFLLGILAMFLHADEAQLLLPVIVLGGLLFHILFEARAQYVVNFLPFLCPVAAYGLLHFGRKKAASD